VESMECVVKRPFFHRRVGRRLEKDERIDLTPHEAKAIGPRFISITTRGLKGPHSHKMIENASNK